MLIRLGKSMQHPFINLPDTFQTELIWYRIVIHEDAVGIEKRLEIVPSQPESQHILIIMMSRGSLYEFQ